MDFLPALHLRFAKKLAPQLARLQPALSRAWLGVLCWQPCPPQPVLRRLADQSMLDLSAVQTLSLGLARQTAKQVRDGFER